MIRITVEVGERKDSPIGGTFIARRVEREYVTLRPEDFENRGVRTLCIEALHKAIDKAMGKEVM
jgi:hypothetical protein